MKLNRLDPDAPRLPFSCGDADLDEFFAVDSVESAKELLSVTYAVLDEDGNVLAFVSLSNDSIKREECPRSAFERIAKLFSQRKRYSSVPTAKIGRLGVCTAKQRSGLGTEILDYLKVSFTSNNKTGCRFLVVDAYNTPKAIKFYQQNDFEFLTGKDENSETRIMYFDLKTFRP